MDFMPERAYISVEDGWRIVRISGNKGAGDGGISCTAMPESNAAQVPTANQIVQHPWNVASERPPTAKGQRVGEIAIQVMGSIKIGVSTAGPGPQHIAYKTVAANRRTIRNH